MYEIHGSEVHPSGKFKQLIKEMPECFGQLIVLILDKKTLANGLNPELAAKAGNALQKYVMENTRLGNSDVLAEEALTWAANWCYSFPTGIGMAAVLVTGISKRSWSSYR